MRRLPLITDTVASEAQEVALRLSATRRGVRLNLFRAMAHSPEATARVSGVGDYLRFDSLLPPRLREAVILAISARWNCDYERVIHEPAGRAAGLTDAVVAELREGRIPAGLSDAEAACVAYAIELSESGVTSDALWSAMEVHLSAQQIVELHLVIGYYSMLAMFLNGVLVPTDETS